MTWWAIDVRTTPEERERLGAWLVARTGQAVEERDDGTLVTFAPDESAADELIAQLGRWTGPPAGGTGWGRGASAGLPSRPPGSRRRVRRVR
jgi:hypothetical protein